VTSSLIEARARAENLGKSLPDSVSVGALGVLTKAPWKALCFREALIWRTEELARSACHSLEADDLAAGILLTRAVMECTALMWRARHLIETRHQAGAPDLNEAFDRMLLGWKGDDELPAAYNIMTMIEHIDRVFPGYRRNYDHLSELAHPNWSGVAGIFSKIDRENFITYFGKAMRGAEEYKEMDGEVLISAIGLFEYAYNAMSDDLPDYLAEQPQI